MTYTWKLVATILLLLSGLLVKPQNTRDFRITPEPPKVERVIPTIPVLPPQLHAICGCESNWNPNSEPDQSKRHLNDNGSIDYGACQINDRSWDATAKKLELDYQHSKADNYKLALYIYRKYGTQPWEWSRSCWAK